MRKVTNNAVNAFLAHRNFSEGNTTVISNGAISGIYLHGNLIAERNIETGKTVITNCGWATNTTKERLNAIPGVNISQKNWTWYLNGKQCDGELIEI